MVTRNCKAHTFRYPRAFCLGMSDHLPIQAYLDQMKIRGREPPRISLARRMKPELQEQVIKNMEELLPQLTAELDTVNSKEELDALYERYVKLRVEPFMPKGANRSCKRRKYFWTKQMSKDSVARGKLWKKWLYSQKA